MHVVPTWETSVGSGRKFPLLVQVPKHPGFSEKGEAFEQDKCMDITCSSSGWNQSYFAHFRADLWTMMLHLLWCMALHMPISVPGCCGGIRHAQMSLELAKPKWHRRTPSRGRMVAAIWFRKQDSGEAVPQCCSDELCGSECVIRRNIQLFPK